jgi:hypothetical protein
MRRLSVYVLLLISAIVITPVLFDQLCMFVFLGKIPFLNVNLSAIPMIIFWIVIIPICRILRAAIPVSFDDIKELIQYLSRKRRVNNIVYPKDYLTLLFIYLAHEAKKTETSEPDTRMGTQKLAPSLT